MEAIFVSDDRAAELDAIEASARERRREDAKRLRAACATVDQIADAPPAPLAGVSRFAARVLGLVVAAVARGFAGAAISAREIGCVLAKQDGRALKKHGRLEHGYSQRWVFGALAELRELGALRVTHDYIPAAESQLGALLESYPFDNSQIGNLYRLGPGARSVNPKVSCGQVRDQLHREVQFIANCSVQYSASGSGSDSISTPANRRPCEIVDNAGLNELRSAEQKAGAAPSGAGGCPEPEAPLSRRAEAGEGSRANPLPASISSRLWRFLLTGRWS